MDAATRYLLFWTAGCAAGFGAALLVLRRRGALRTGTVVALGLAWLFLFIGAKWHARLEHLPWAEALAVPPAELFRPGRRLPLGLLASGLAATGACLLLRLPWRAVGDACAVFWSVLIPIGRLGCLSYGCCGGVACGPGLAPFCPRYAPGSEVFRAQAAAGLLPPGSAASLPAHPLPLYFAVASVATLVLLVELLRRGAPPGALLLAFGLVRPAVKLALEPLRAAPAAPELQLGIPAATFGAAVVGALVAVRRRAAAAALVVVVAVAAPARAEEPAWEPAIRRWAQDPLRNRRLVRRLGREERGDVPPVVLLALADAQLRARRFAAADALFARAAAADPGAPTAAWAALGRAWAAVLALPPDADARAALDRLVAAAPAGAATALLRAYARWWAGAADAAAAFDAAAAAADGALVDDARYGAARARLRAGDRDTALAMLRDLATWAPTARGTVTPALVALERDAVLRAAFARYRRAPARAPTAQLHRLLDGDGALLARAALRTLEDPPRTPAAPPRRRSAARAAIAADRPRAPRTASAEPAARRELRLDALASALRPLLLPAALVALGLALHDRLGGRHHGRRPG